MREFAGRHQGGTLPDERYVYNMENHHIFAGRMRTNIEIDDALPKAAMEATGDRDFEPIRVHPGLQAV
jgi:hypothetical protein